MLSQKLPVQTVLDGSSALTWGDMRDRSTDQWSTEMNNGLSLQATMPA